MGEESGPLHLALTTAANNMGVELPWSIGLHPLEQQSLLWGSHVKLIDAGALMLCMDACASSTTQLDRW